MYEATVEALTKKQGDRYNPEPFTLYLSVNYHGIEEEAQFRYESLKDIPRFLLEIKNGRPHYKRGQKVYVSHPHHDANGLIFLYLHENKDEE